MASLLKKLPFGKQPPPKFEEELSIYDHLREFRDRLIISVVALLITTAISFAFTGRLIDLLLYPSGLQSLQVLNPTESFTTWMQVAFVAGFVLSLPVISWQIVAFVLPGLYPHEKRIVFALLPGITICFLIGASFSYFLMLPAALSFLRTFGEGRFNPEWRAAEYLELVTQLIFWTGMTFQTPLIMFVTAKLGMVSSKQFASYRKYAFLLAFVIGAIITPTADPGNLLLCSLPVYVLYELGILLSKFARPKPIEVTE